MTRHGSPRYRGRTAHAPYNFVPLPDDLFDVAARPEWIVPDESDPRKLWECHDRWLDGKHSGWIDLEITARTPVYVRCGVAPEEAEGDDPRDNLARQHFFHHGNENEPWIPGSTLKGMTRSLVEIMSRGKFGPVSERKMFYRGVGDRSSMGDLYRAMFLDDLGPGKVEYPSTRIHAGFLVCEGDRRAIRPAKQHHGQSFVHVEYSAATPIINGWGRHQVHSVWVHPVARSESSGHGPRHNITLNMALLTQRTQIAATQEAGMVKGFLVESGHMGNTDYDARKPNVIPRSPEKHMHCVVYEPDEDAPLIPISDVQWRQYQDDRDLQRDANRTPRSLEENEPLFYRLDDDDGLDFFGPTMMFRLPYRSTPATRAPSRPGAIDLADAMFGTVSRQTTIKGRVFFESARWRPEAGDVSPFYEDNGGLRSPKILGAPKPTAFQMYLEQPHPEYARDLEHWDSERAAVRGWKRYWHRKTQDRAPGHEESPFEEQVTHSTQHTIIRPVRPSTRFSSRVRFENLNSIELGALLTALNLPESQCHHIGMGKPRGMGSVRIEATLHLLLRRPVSDSPRTDTARTLSRYERMLNDDGAFHSGELNDARAAETGTACRDSFQLAIAGSPGKLWSLSHMRELAALLEWNDAPHPTKSHYMDLDGWWRERPVLPLASKIEEVSLGDMPPPRRPPARERRQEQRQTGLPVAEAPPSTVSKPPAAETRRVSAADGTTIWTSVRVTLSGEPAPIIRASRPGGGPPAEATQDEFEAFGDVAERLRAAPGKSAIARHVTIQPRSRKLPLIVKIEW